MNSWDAMLDPDVLEWVAGLARKHRALERAKDAAAVLWKEKQTVKLIQKQHRLSEARAILYITLRQQYVTPAALRIVRERRIDPAILPPGDRKRARELHKRLKNSRLRKARVIGR